MSPSPTRCRGPWKLHKRSSEPDRWLEEMGFFRKHTARDSSCLFRAVSENIYNTQRYFQNVRFDTVQFMAANRHLFEGSLTCKFENYLREMSNPSEWGGLVEIAAMSHLYRRDFVIFEANKGPENKICNGYGKTIFLFYSPETKHFDAVYTKDFIISSSFCQSMVYEILYDRVYQLKDLSYAVDKMLHEKLPTNHVEYFMSENVERRKKQKDRAKIFIEAAAGDDKDISSNSVALKCKHHTRDLERASVLKESLSIFVFNRSLVQLENVCMNCLNVNSAKDLLDNGITPFPYKVAKALDPDIYRNIEFDVWSEMRRELRYAGRYSDGKTLQVGVKCLCKLQPDKSETYHCHIQEMRPDGGPCLVFIEELGEKRVVNYDQLEPLPLEEIRPWAPPYRYSRGNSQFLSLSQMLQQIGNITRKGLKTRSKSKNAIEESKISEKPTQNQKQMPKLGWKDNAIESEMAFDQENDMNNINFSTYQHLDFLNFEPMPVEVQALPLMVDCRPAGAGGAGGSGGAHEMPPHTLAHHTPNGASNVQPTENHHNQTSASGDMGGHGVTPAAARASTPAATTTLTTYTGNMGMPPGQGYTVPCAPYMCGMKGVVWCSPHSPPPPHAPPLPPPPPPPPPSVNPHVFKSVQPNGADLPMNDIPTLRYYFNLGVECMWAAYGPPPPHPPHPPPRHYSPRDIAMDMQQMSLQDRGMNHSGDHKHKMADNKQPPHNNKGNSQRPLLPPRFKRGQDGNQNSHNQNKGHNNNMPNKGPNNRRNMHNDSRNNQPQYNSGGNMALSEDCVLEQPLLTLPYIPYPPPLYPIPYYPIESDPAMMGMMSGMGYVGYEEPAEYPPLPPYYPPAPYPAPPPAPAPAPAPPTHQQEHK